MVSNAYIWWQHARSLAANRRMKESRAALATAYRLLVEDIANVLGMTDRTARRHWVFAKAWLCRELTGAVEGSGA